MRYMLQKNSLMFVAVSDKKTQQATIDAIKMAFEVYKKDVLDRFAKK